MKERLGKIRKACFSRPYIFFFILIFIVYIFLNTYVNQLYVTFPTLFKNNLMIIIPYFILTVLIALLVPLNINLVIIKIKELKQLSKYSGVSAFGIFGGILGGACPSCFVGLFPAFLGLFGITASLSSLPLYGLEIQLVSFVLLLIGAYFLTNKNVCK